MALGQWARRSNYGRNLFDPPPNFQAHWRSAWPVDGVESVFDEGGKVDAVGGGGGEHVTRH